MEIVIDEITDLIDYSENPKDYHYLLRRPYKTHP